MCKYLFLSGTSGTSGTEREEVPSDLGFCLYRVLTKHPVHIRYTPSRRLGWRWTTTRCTLGEPSGEKPDSIASTMLRSAPGHGNAPASPDSDRGPSRGDLPSQILASST